MYKSLSRTSYYLFLRPSTEYFNQTLLTVSILFERLNKPTVFTQSNQ
jgi:hypothetical protein